MNDRLDERIRAFVAELVGDPPAIPPLPETQLVTVTRRRVSGPVVAVAVFVAVLVLGTLVALLQPFGPQADMVTDLSTPTTRAASTETFLGVPVEPAVPFQVRVRYAEGEWTATSASYVASVEVSYLGPGVFRAELVSVGPDPGRTSLEERTGVGSYVVADGTTAASFLAARDLFLRFPAEETTTLDLGELAWGHWADRCRDVDHEIVEEATILDRRAFHVRCAEVGGDVELWVDTETGLVLSARTAPTATSVGDLPISDELGIYANGFQTDNLELGATPSAGLFVVSAPGSSQEHQIIRQDRRVVAANADCGVDCAETDRVGLGEHPLVGSPAPPLTGVLLDGASFDLVTLRGERVALLWWASWCDPSLDLLLDFDHHAPQRPDINFIGVLMQDDPKKAAAAVERGGISIPNLDTGSLDPPPDWQVEGCPETLLVAEDGTVTAGIRGPWPDESLESFLAQAGW